ncbi:MAG: hypothetical protein HY979_01810, partial [Candidatus Magasanikbacteria bacterium]|nr:hypothetical protein [Candidatus Magasanikbacteria bacterium]
MAFPHLEDLLEFEEKVVYPEGVKISQLEHFPRNFNPFVLKQYLAEVSKFPDEYQRLTSFYQDVIIPLKGKKTAAFKEISQIIKETDKQKRNAVERLESILLLPYTTIITAGDYVQRMTGSTFLGVIGVMGTTTIMWCGLGKAGWGAQMACIASFLTGMYKHTTETKERICRMKQYQEVFAAGMETLNR